MATNTPKIVYIECSKCKTQTPIGKFCIECGEKNTVEFLDYRIKSQKDANPTMIRICSYCNIDSNHIESKRRPFDSWSRNFINSKCTNCEKMNPKTIEIKLSDYNKLIVIK
uniref:DZANK-type domain-containing protein n=1 Tax=viral metagenome TaxID=1070528 RepID=A0A6C0KDG5_9ZZZZ